MEEYEGLFRGEDGPLERLQRAVYRNVAWICRRLRLTPGDGEGIITTVLPGLFRQDCAALRHVREPERLDAWLRVILWRVAIKVSAGRPRARCESDLPRGMADRATPMAEGGEPAASAWGLSDAEPHLEQLTPSQAEVVRLHSIEGLSFRRVADETGKSVDTCKKLFRRGLARLTRLHN